MIFLLRHDFHVAYLKMSFNILRVFLLFQWSDFDYYFYFIKTMIDIYYFMDSKHCFFCMC